MVLNESASAPGVPGSHVPTGALGRFIAEIRVVLNGDAEQSYVGLPQGQARLFLRLQYDGHAGERAPRNSELLVLGARTRAVYKTLANDSVLLVVRFRPACAQPFFRVPMLDLADQVVPIEELWGADGARLLAQIAAARDSTPRDLRPRDRRPTDLRPPDLRQCVALLEAALRERLPLVDCACTQSWRAARAIATIKRGESMPTVRRLASELGSSERQLRRVFDATVGVAPKPFMRIVRFHRALRAAARATPQSWSSIASDAGYSDQAHFISECRRLTGRTPSSFMQVWSRTGECREPLL